MGAHETDWGRVGDAGEPLSDGEARNIISQIFFSHEAKNFETLREGQETLLLPGMAIGERMEAKNFLHFRRSKISLPVSLLVSENKVMLGDG